MSIIIQKVKDINDEVDWFLYAPPQGGKTQWKDGYSAKEFARFATRRKEFQTLINEVLKKCELKTGISFTCEPEALTSLPYSSGPRHHDLLMRSQKLIIGIEAKVNETFGKTIEKETKDAGKAKNARIEWLTDTLFPDHKNCESVDHLNYQLLTGLAGTLLEAKRADVKQCIFLIVEFIKEGEDANPRNQEDFERFEALLPTAIVSQAMKRVFMVKEPKEKHGTKIGCWLVKKQVAI